MPEKKYIQVQKNNSILSDVCEALIGAIYLDSDIKEAKKFIQKYWKKKINKEILPPKDAKSLLQEIAQKKGLNLPKYKLTSKKGPSHNPKFEIEVKLEGFKSFKDIIKFFFTRFFRFSIFNLNFVNATVKFKPTHASLWMAAYLPREYHIPRGHRCSITPPGLRVYSVGDRNPLFTVRCYLGNREIIFDGG